MFKLGILVKVELRLCRLFRPEILLSLLFLIGYWCKVVLIGLIVEDDRVTDEWLIDGLMTDFLTTVFVLGIVAVN